MISSILAALILLPYLMYSAFKLIYVVIKKKVNGEDIHFEDDTESNSQESKRINYYGLDDKWGCIK